MVATIRRQVHRVQLCPNPVQRCRVAPPVVPIMLDSSTTNRAFASRFAASDNPALPRPVDRVLAAVRRTMES
jgi:hypothetical protein